MPKHPVPWAQELGFESALDRVKLGKMVTRERTGEALEPFLLRVPLVDNPKVDFNPGVLDFPRRESPGKSTLVVEKRNPVLACVPLSRLVDLAGFLPLGKQWR